KMTTERKLLSVDTYVIPKCLVSPDSIVLGDAVSGSVAYGTLHLLQYLGTFPDSIPISVEIEAGDPQLRCKVLHERIGTVDGRQLFEGDIQVEWMATEPGMALRSSMRVRLKKDRTVLASIEVPVECFARHPRFD